MGYADINPESGRKLDRAAAQVGICDTRDILFSQMILGLSFGEFFGAVDEENLTLVLLGLVEDQDNAGGSGVVEQVFRQEDDALDQVSLDEHLANVAFSVRVGVPAVAPERIGSAHSR